MATYKQTCIHCSQLVERDARVCPNCGSRSPFGYSCPTCLREIEHGQRICSGCGRALHVTCPTCGQLTFVDAKCDKCGANLMITCTNMRCNEPQFFENINCTVCGKKIKK